MCTIDQTHYNYYYFLTNNAINKILYLKIAKGFGAIILTYLHARVFLLHKWLLGGWCRALYSQLYLFLVGEKDRNRSTASIQVYPRKPTSDIWKPKNKKPEIDDWWTARIESENELLQKIAPWKRTLAYNCCN